VDRQVLLASLVIVTLIVNIVLGIELYYALHRANQPISQVPINVSNVQIVSSSNSVQTSNTQTSTSTLSTNTSTLYSFSFTAKLKVHVKDKGLYLVGIKPKINFSQLYIVLYFEDGNVVTLNLNHTSSNVSINDKEVEITIYISGKAYQNLTYQEVLNGIGLYFQLISPHHDNENNDDLILIFTRLLSINLICTTDLLSS